MRYPDPRGSHSRMSDGRTWPGGGPLGNADLSAASPGPNIGETQVVTADCAVKHDRFSWVARPLTRETFG
jgi:hypothetical protein